MFGTPYSLYANRFWRSIVERRDHITFVHDSVGSETLQGCQIGLIQGMGSGPLGPNASWLFRVPQISMLMNRKIPLIVLT